MNYRNRQSVLGFVIFGVGLIFIILYKFFSSFYGQLTLWLTIGGILAYHIGRWFFLDTIYEKYSVNSVPKALVVNHTTIRNSLCTVILTPKEKIIVMDNGYYVNNSKRMFSISKKDINVSKQWNKICKFFDQASSLDSLASFCNIETVVEIVTIDTKPGVSEQVASAPVPEASAELVKTEQADEVEPVSGEKVDINSASANELSTLPGVNIVGAKKIVEYRNLNGLFTSEDEFIKAANVKEHFIPKIKSMIIIGKSQQIQNVADTDGGRVVDF